METAQEDQATGATLVLVHGSWHGAWAWSQLQAELDARAISSVAIDLPGKGRAAGGTDFEGHCAAVTHALDQVAGPTVLVAHSYGGVIATQVGDHPRVEGIVYVASFNLAEGETVAQTVDTAGGSKSGADALMTDADGFLVIDPETAISSFYNDCAATVAAQAAARLTPEYAASRTVSPTHVAWRSVPSTYVVCTQDLALPAATQRVLARRATWRTELASGHSPMLSMPAQLADVLVEAAGRQGAVAAAR
jgi:pimeloyl-ACP methyl ester carboxylesterase